MCSSKERYEVFMKYMAANGIICIASDLRGHGESIRCKNDLGYMYKGGYKALVSDLRQVCCWGHSKFPKLPYYLLGHSMGSLAVRLLARQDDTGLAGLIICGSPSWDPRSIIGKWIARTGCAMGLEHIRPKILFDIVSNRYNRRFASEGPLSWTCSDPTARQSFIENPLYNFTFTMNGTYNLLALMGDIYKTASWKVANPSLPIIFISGEDDPCLINEQKFHRAAYQMCKAGYKNVSSVLYPKMRHEVLNDIDKTTVWNEILTFIKIENFGNE